MKPIKLRLRADRDIERIIAYYLRVAPEAVPAIAADIDRSLGLIEAHPERNPAIAGTAYRRLVTKRYKFKIAYRVGRDVTEIVGIYRYQNRTA